MAHVPHVPHVPKQAANPIEAEAILERLHCLLKRGRELGRKPFRILADCLPDLRAHICTRTNANPQRDAQRSVPRKDSRLFVRSAKGSKGQLITAAWHAGCGRQHQVERQYVRSLPRINGQYPLQQKQKRKRKILCCIFVLRLLLRLPCGRAHRKRVNSIVHRTESFRFGCERSVACNKVLTECDLLRLKLWDICSESDTS